MTRLRVAVHSDLREHGDQAAVYAQRRAAVDAVACKIAPALGWKPAALTTSR